jgi:uncharacterized protein (TIGR03437 family)
MPSKLTGASLILVFSVFLCSAPAICQPLIKTVAGSGFTTCTGPTPLYHPYEAIEDSTGAIYVADAGNNRIVKGLSSISYQTSVAYGTQCIQTIVVFAGNGAGTYGGDSGPAASASLYAPQDMVFDPQGNLYVSDTNNNRIRKITTAGIIVTVAGVGVAGFSGDGGPAVNAAIHYPAGITSDSLGNVYFVDLLNQRIRKITPQGVISTVAGNGMAGYGGDGALATNAELQNPEGVAVDQAGNLYIADNYNNRIRKVSASTGMIETVVGTGVGGYNGDGIPATMAMIHGPPRVAVAPNGDLYIADTGNQRIRRVDGQTELISTVAGNGTAGYSGDGGPATQAELNIPHSVYLDSGGRLLFAEYGNNVVRAVAPDGTISTVVGAVSELLGAGGFSGDGGLATSARLYLPGGVATDAGGNQYIADGGNNRIRRVASATGIITTIAGGGAAECSDGSVATSCSLSCVGDIAADGAGDVFVAESCGHSLGFTGYSTHIRRVDAKTDVMTTLTALPQPPVGINFIEGIAVDDGSDVFFGANLQNGGYVYKVNAETFALSVFASLSLPPGEGSFYPDALAIDGADNIYLTAWEATPCATSSCQLEAWPGIMRIDGATGNISTVAVNAGSVATDTAGNLYFCGNNHIRRVDAATQIITSVGGNGSLILGLSGDGGLATLAGGSFCSGLAFAGSGALFASDYINNRVREIDLPPPAEAARPSFTSAGVVNTASSQAVSALASGAFFSIYGTNLAPKSPASGTNWSGLFQGSSAPTSIDGVRVLVNGLPAYLAFVSNSQINAIAPDDSRTWDTVVRVVNSAGISDPVIVERSAVSPALFTVTRNGFSYAATSSVTYHSGDVVTLWGNGFGPTNPAVPAGQLPAVPAVLPNVTATIGGNAATIQFAGLTEVGLYQFNVVVPEVPSGNQAIAIQVAGVSTPAGVFLSVK